MLVYYLPKPGELLWLLTFITSFKRKQMIGGKLSVNESISYFKDDIQKLVDEHGEIRLIIGFDS